MTGNSNVDVLESAVYQACAARGAQVAEHGHRPEMLDEDKGCSNTTSPSNQYELRENRRQKPALSRHLFDTSRRFAESQSPFIRHLVDFSLYL